jgi:transcription antitermination factor NusG
MEGSMSRQDDEARYLGIAARREAIHGPYHSEMMPGVDPKWHILKIVPGQDSIAMSHLIARRFGVYQPRGKRKVKGHHGRPAREQSFPLMPGYLLIFVWDVNHHKRRILACPGVTRFVMEGAGIYEVPDVEIRKLQVTENKESGQGTPKKRPRRRRKARDVNERDEGSVTIRVYSAWSNIHDDILRGGDDALKKALALT